MKLKGLRSHGVWITLSFLFAMLMCFTALGVSQADVSGPPVVKLTNPRNGQKFPANTPIIRLAGQATDMKGLRALEISAGNRTKNIPVNGKMVDLARYPVDVKGLKGTVQITVFAVGVNGQKFPADTAGIQLGGQATDAVGLKALEILSGGVAKNIAVSGKSVDLSGYSVDVKGRKGTVQIRVVAVGVDGKRSTPATTRVVIGKGLTPKPGPRPNPKH